MPLGEVSYWDAADGGTTASVAVLFDDGARLVVATVGDSSVALLGRTAAQGSAESRILIEDHSPINVKEFERLRALPEAAALRFVYDCPDGERIDVFAVDDAAAAGGAAEAAERGGSAAASSAASEAAPSAAGSCEGGDTAGEVRWRAGGGARGVARLDVSAEKRADEHECGVKNARGELVTVVVLPESTLQVTALGTHTHTVPAHTPLPPCTLLFLAAHAPDLLVCYVRVCWQVTAAVASQHGIGDDLRLTHSSRPLPPHNYNCTHSTHSQHSALTVRRVLCVRCRK